MRNIARAAACGAVLALSGLSLAGTAGAGQTGGSQADGDRADGRRAGADRAGGDRAGTGRTGAGSLYAPSALVLGVIDGADHRSGTVRRAVTLSCAPKPSGTHPDPVGACAELRAHEADFDAITASRTDRGCTKEWQPVIVTADGAWDGRRVSYVYTFGNACALEGGRGKVFSF